MFVMLGIALASPSPAEVEDETDTRCLTREERPAAPTAEWSADDREQPALLLVADPEVVTWFEAQFDVRFLEHASSWSAGPWVVPAGTSLEVSVPVPSDALEHPSQASVLTWIGASVGFSEGSGAPMGDRALQGWLTIEATGAGFLSDGQAAAVAPGGAYTLSAQDLLAEAEAWEAEVVLELAGGPAGALPALSSEEVAP
jgi:hypothetical protein